MLYTVLLLIATTPGPKPSGITNQFDKPNPIDTAADLEFRRIEINWIADTHIIYDLDQVLSHYDAVLIRALGSKHYEIRWLAQETLIRLRYESFPAVCWGTRSTDPEIKYISNMLQARFFICPDCDNADRPWNCTTCYGSGDLRYRGRDEDGRLIPAYLFVRPMTGWSYPVRYGRDHGDIK